MTGSHEVVGSIPISSTKLQTYRFRCVTPGVSWRIIKDVTYPDSKGCSDKENSFRPATSFVDDPVDPGCITVGNGTKCFQSGIVWRLFPSLGA